MRMTVDKLLENMQYSPEEVRARAEYRYPCKDNHEIQNYTYGALGQTHIVCGSCGGVLDDPDEHFQRELADACEWGSGLLGIWATENGITAWVYNSQLHVVSNRLQAYMMNKISAATSLEDSKIEVVEDLTIQEQLRAIKRGTR
jgi:hypothetical protein